MRPFPLILWEWMLSIYPWRPLISPTIFCLPCHGLGQGPGKAHHQPCSSSAQSQMGEIERPKVEGRVKGQFSDGSSDVENRMRTWWQPWPFFLASTLNLSPETCLLLCLSIYTSLGHLSPIHPSIVSLSIDLSMDLSNLSSTIYLSTNHLLPIFLNLFFPFSPFLSPFLPSFSKIKPILMQMSEIRPELGLLLF